MQISYSLSTITLHTDCVTIQVWYQIIDETLQDQSWFDMSSNHCVFWRVSMVILVCLRVIFSWYLTLVDYHSFNFNFRIEIWSFDYTSNIIGILKVYTNWISLKMAASSYIVTDKLAGFGTVKIEFEFYLLRMNYFWHYNFQQTTILTTYEFNENWVIELLIHWSGHSVIITWSRVINFILRWHSAMDIKNVEWKTWRNQRIIEHQ